MGRYGVMQEGLGEPADRSLDVDFFMDRYIAEAACISSKKAEFPLHAPVPESHEPSTVGRPEGNQPCIECRVVAGFDEFLLEPVGYAFIAVNGKDPITRCQVQCVVLLGAESLPGNNMNMGCVFPGNFSRSIAALSIDDDDLVSPCHAGEAFTNIVLFVPGNDDDADGWPNH